MKPPLFPGKKFKILVIYNVVEKLLYGSEKDKMAEEDTIAHAKLIVNILRKNGHKVFEMEVYEDFADEILAWKDKVDIVFNLTEGVGNDILKSPYVPFILESLQIPFTGCGWESHLLTLDKAKTKEFLSLYNILTPPYAVFESMPESLPSHLAFPLFVKPALADASYGIDKNAIVHNQEELANRIKYILEVYKMPALVEHFIDGMDVSVGVLGNDYDDLDILFPYAIIYKNLSHDEYPILTFDSKFDTTSDIYKNTHIVYPAPLSLDTVEEIRGIAAKAYKLCKCSGYARLDLRVDKNMKPYFLELNANPAIDNETGFRYAAEDSGLTYNDFIESIVHYAYEKTLLKNKSYKNEHKRL